MSRSLKFADLAGTELTIVKATVTFLGRRSPGRLMLGEQTVATMESGSRSVTIDSADGRCELSDESVGGTIVVGVPSSGREIARFVPDAQIAVGGMRLLIAADTPGSVQSAAGENYRLRYDPFTSDVEISMARGVPLVLVSTTDGEKGQRLTITDAAASLDDLSWLVPLAWYVSQRSLF